ncbi:hypothetical protein [Lysobacter capsici]|uniref:hypothetical protein n=1 Tax=Lysobacter capsici TaxID=435897 RepID=UPI00287B6C4E|nr:hypothetical protein [Lysobacter capsici]WND79415.1 hypothetical protein RJ610_19240 [Lysobacter capsici]WND84611.1 hypothetical protein RJ609_19255 [Lysobacter capsici]
MDVEERLGSLDETVHDLAMNAMAMDLAVQALIGTHPDPKLAGDVLQRLLSERLSRIPDIGFDRGYEARTAKATGDELRRRAGYWIRLFGVEPAA